jgi:hypothetical protein
MGFGGGGRWTNSSKYPGLDWAPQMSYPIMTALRMTSQKTTGRQKHYSVSSV